MRSPSRLKSRIQGKGARPTPAGCTPGFRWPLGSAGREGALVQFDKAERPEVPELAPGGLVRSTTRPVPLCGLNLPLSDALFAHDALFPRLCEPVAVLYRRLRSVDHDGVRELSARCAVDPASRALPVSEAWTGYSDPDGFTGDLFDKPGMRVLEPGAGARHEARFVFRPE